MDPTPLGPNTNLGWPPSLSEASYSWDPQRDLGGFLYLPSVLWPSQGPEGFRLVASAHSVVTCLRAPTGVAEAFWYIAP